MTSQVKICGLTRSEDVEAAISCGADYLGFIVEAKSKRRIDVAQAAKLAGPAKGIIPRVAVTVNADDRLLDQIMSDMLPDFIQCHGDETPEQLAAIAKRYGVKTIKAVAIESAADMRRAEQYAGSADLVLYDAKPPFGQARGGHGLAFDWTLLAHNPHPKMFALAGGLTPENVTEAIARTNAPILDVSSGVETSPGFKDHAKIKAFMTAADSSTARTP